MIQRLVILGCGVMLACVVAVGTSGVAAAAGQVRQATPTAGSSRLMPTPRQSPLQVDAKVLATGRAVFKDKCTKCHGAAGLGDGPDADPEHREDMDLTNPKRADRNADGVVFYKVANGRRRPKMPAFKEELNEQQIWSVVAYVQTLRKK